MKKIYLDYAATTPVADDVLEAMRPYFSERFGNPGSLHSFGQEAVKAVDESREAVAKAIGADFREVIFTGSATEANNLALRGVVKSLKIENLKLKLPRIVVSAVEHESVLNTARNLDNEGVEVVVLPVNKEGIVDLKKLKESLDERTVLVSVMYANNEVGAVQPIAEIAEIIREFKNLKIKIKNSDEKAYPLFHSDAVQAFQYLNCDVDRLGVDLMTLSAHKIYGPKGTGLLYVRNPNLKFKISNLKLPVMSALITGGGQEFGLRSGTENVPSIVGFAKAAEIVEEKREKERERVGELRDYFWKELKKIYPRAEINAGGILKYTTLLPNILNVYFPDHKSEDLLIKLDMEGVSVSSGSACSARSPKPSHVLIALGYSNDRVRRSIRFSFGRFTTREELDEALLRLKKLLR